MGDFYQAASQQNYQAAKNYYAQRRQMLNNLFTKDTQNFFEEVIKYINEKITEYQEKVVNVVFSKLNFENGQYFYNGKPLENVSYPVQNVIERIGDRRMTQRNIASFLGLEFESFMEHALATDELAKVVSSESVEIINSLISGFTKTGNITSKSAITEGRRAIRPDIGLGMAMQIDNSGVARLKNSNTAVEFQALVDLSELVPEEKEITSAEVLQSYLNTNAFGFSMKLWKDGNNKEFSQSSTLQKMINSQLKTYDSFGRRLTWETNYTESYVVYQLSKYLLNIIGPMNVAIISGRNFTWMNDFIDNRIFYMTVQAENLFEKSKRGAGYEIYPHIPDSSIKLKTLNNTMQIFKTSFSEKTGRISIRKRRIIT